MWRCRLAQHDRPLRPARAPRQLEIDSVSRKFLRRASGLAAGTRTESGLLTQACLGVRLRLKAEPCLLHKPVEPARQANQKRQSLLRIVRGCDRVETASYRWPLNGSRPREHSAELLFHTLRIRDLLGFRAERGVGVRERPRRSGSLIDPSDGCVDRGPDTEEDTGVGRHTMMV